LPLALPRPGGGRAGPGEMNGVLRVRALRESDSYTSQDEKSCCVRGGMGFII
jgi:hypothetical protein